MTNTKKNTRPQILATILATKQEEVKGGMRFLFLIWNITEQKFQYVSTYVKKSQTKLIDYYASKKRHDLVAITLSYHIFKNRTYYNIWKMFDRHKKTKQTSQPATAPQAQATVQTQPETNTETHQQPQTVAATINKPVKKTPVKKAVETITDGFTVNGHTYKHLGLGY